LFGPKKGKSDDQSLAAAEVSDSREVTTDRLSPQREAWRRAAQSVTRTWSEWSAAADSRRRSELYRRYISALDEEEQAAATLEQLLNDDAGTPSEDTRAAVLPSVPGSCG
jgi:hypothetical protein